GPEGGEPAGDPAGPEAGQADGGAHGLVAAEGVSGTVGTDLRSVQARNAGALGQRMKRLRREGWTDRRSVPTSLEPVTDLRTLTGERRSSSQDHIMGGVNPYITKPELKKPTRPFKVTIHVEETGERKVFQVDPDAIPFGHTGLE